MENNKLNMISKRYQLKKYNYNNKKVNYLTKFLNKMSKGRVKLTDERDGKRYYQITSGGKDEQFIVDVRYELIDMIGSGAYGIVCAAKDHGDIGEDG